MADNNEMQSAMLTATIKSLKVLQELKAEQTGQTILLKELRDTQKNNAKVLELINELPTRDEINVLINSLTAISDAQRKLLTQADESQKRLLKRIDDTDASANLEVIKRLVQGMKQVHENMVILTKSMDKLGQNVNDVHNDSQELSDVIMNSNSRILSMDMRMAAFTNLAQGSSIDNVDDALDLLTNLSDEHKKPDHVKVVNKKVAESHRNLREYLNNLDQELGEMPKLSDDKAQSDDSSQSDQNKLDDLRAALGDTSDITDLDEAASLLNVPKGGEADGQPK